MTYKLGTINVVWTPITNSNGHDPLRGTVDIEVRYRERERKEQICWEQPDRLGDVHIGEEVARDQLVALLNMFILAYDLVALTKLDAAVVHQAFLQIEEFRQFYRNKYGYCDDFAEPKLRREYGRKML
jgi:hypothetical protein